jgi:predicted dithiol-disulfide oxidoreductase (DUF899 family)
MRHRTGTGEDRLRARLELLEAEKERTRRSDGLTRPHPEPPWVRIDKEYRFETDEGAPRWQTSSVFSELRNSCSRMVSG